MSLYTLRPISDRTPFTGKHTGSPFRSTWSVTRSLLGDELRAIKASNVVLEVDVEERDLRLDGEIRANAKAASPAVRLAFDSVHGPLVYATDRFTSKWYSDPMSDWQHNVRAIALGLEALRKVDRYGITRRGEQYAGWKAIGAGVAMPASHMTLDEAVDVIAAAAGAEYEVGATDGPARIALARSLIRRAKANAHPDRNNGDRTEWDQVEQAALVLERSA